LKLCKRVEHEIELRAYEQKIERSRICKKWRYVLYAQTIV
jgi:hypothetical protein